MSVYVVGVALHPPADNVAHLRLEEMAYHTVPAALDAAGVSRRQLDSKAEVITDVVPLRYDYSLGEVAGRFMAGLKEGEILATRCSKSGLIGNYVDGLDLSDYEAAMKKLAPGKRVRVEFAETREGRITDFSFFCID